MTGVAASKQMQAYFDRMKEDCAAAFQIARQARAKGYDPENDVSVTLAETLAERVIGLISVIAPQIKGVGVEKRIEELEAQYGSQDWRVAFVIAHEIAQQKYCTFTDELAAITVGIRVGFAYVTLGVVSAPLEGVTTIELKDRLDGQGKYFCLRFAGPIRNAGGTAAAVCVLIGDYVRVKMGFAAYDPTDKEIKRCPAEIEDYHEWITNLQYFPSKEESIFLMERIPIEIGGEASEKYEVSNINLKDLPRIPENQLRSGYCLIHSSCIPLKAAKLWKNLEKWGDEMGMGHWNFLKEFLALQKKMKAAGKKVEGGAKISPDYTYIKDLVAGRPVLSYPLRPGGMRLRYGRTRASGYSGQAIHPATMLVLNDYIASGTQLKVERPGKAASYMPCDTIDGPIVKLRDGTVLQLQDEAVAKRLSPQVARILYLGDVLVNYGDFYNRNHLLVPVGYCPEWWIQEVQRTVETAGGVWSASSLASLTGVSESTWQRMIDNPLQISPSAQEAIAIATATQTPLHSAWTPYWSQLLREQLMLLVNAVRDMKIEADQRPEKIADTTAQSNEQQESNRAAADNAMRSAASRGNDDSAIEEKGMCTLANAQGVKEALERIGLPHRMLLSRPDVIFLSESHAFVLRETLGLSRLRTQEVQSIIERMPTTEHILTSINAISTVTVRDKGGTFIGARMGRPEKAKMRKLTGSPHTLFPIGEEGGRLRSIQEALVRGKITAEYPLRYCTTCKRNTIFGRCEECDNITEQRTTTRKRYNAKETDEPEILTYAKQEIEIRRIFDACLRKIKFRIYPDLIKGVRGTSNRSHIPEHLIKGILRAKHGVSVNKDGTVRYDCSEVTLTHFTPEEVGVSVERLRELGYENDCHGAPLTAPEQVLELRPQDIVIPCCPVSPDEPADEIMFRTGNFIDELLVKLYGLKPYYNFRAKEDVVGSYVVGLAPHTSAGMVGRIVGFSKTQGFLAHPLYHAAMRRDCDGDESCITLLMDVFLNFSSKYLAETRGSTMDAPLVLTSVLIPAEVDDMAFHVDTAWRYPLELYDAALEYKRPGDVKVPLLGDSLWTPAQYEGMGFTHGMSSINGGVLCSAYKTLPSMEEKLTGQMDLAVRIAACDEKDVARLVIEKHFMRDTKGNLRKFTQQEYRCVACNEKFRRPPLVGHCTKCRGKVVFTISEGSVIKYLEPSLSLARKYGITGYLMQDLELLQRKVDDLFGKDAERQEALGKWFG